MLRRWWCNIFTNHDDLAEKIRMIVNHGEKVNIIMKFVGCNSRLDSIQEILNIKLNYLNEYNLNRKSIADNYNMAFKNLENVEIPKVIKIILHVYHQYTLKVKI